MRSAGRERRRRSFGLVLACIAVAAGCRDSDPPPSDDPGLTAPSTTIIETTTAPPTTPTTLIPLDQDPPVIDLAYAQRVLDEISRLDGEASRIIHREKRITAEAEAIMSAIFFGASLDDARRALATDLGVGLQTWRDPPADPVVRALRILSSKPGCIALRADSDVSPRYDGPSDAQRNIGLILQRNINPTDAELRINPSLWLETHGSTTADDAQLLKACQ